MPLKQVLVIGVCLVVGYLLVNALMSPGIKPGAAPPKDDKADANAGEQQSAGAQPDPAVATLSNWYRILGVREKATREEIAAAYKRMISQYHPDKMAQMGAEIRAVAEAKTKQINAAYELAMRIYR